jgi:hypothetical protein
MEGATEGGNDSTPQSFTAEIAENAEDFVLFAFL